MILRSEILEIGRLLKPHGVKGEIAAELYGDIDVTALKCVVVDVDGIFVPFFVESFRPKSHDTCLLKFDNPKSDNDVSLLAKKTLYALKDDVELDEDANEDGFYASDLIGYKASTSDGQPMGTIVDINDDTDNILFIVESVSGDTFLVPVAMEFIHAIDRNKQIVELDLPEGLIDL